MEQNNAAKSLTPAQQARVQEISARMQKATAHLQTQPAKPPAPAEGDANHALMQKAENQNKTQAALSPTDQVKGQVHRSGPSRGR
jgi:hypothetical protein